MIDNFKNCLPVTLREEGGNDDDPHDHGGRTSRGVTQREYDAYRHLKNEPPGDVWQASQQEVNDIYESQYWKPYCDLLPAGLDLCFFDFSVNAGRQQAVKSLQRVVGVPVDGMFGLRTKQAVERFPDLGRLIHAYCDARRSFYKVLAQFPRYGRGWLARTARIEKAALTMANVIVGTKSAPKANPKGVAQPKISPEAKGAASSISSLVAYLLQQFHEPITAFIKTDQPVHIAKYVFLAAAVLGFGFMIHGVIKRRSIQRSLNGDDY